MRPGPSKTQFSNFSQPPGNLYPASRRGLPSAGLPLFRGNPRRKKGAFLCRIWQSLSLKCPRRLLFANKSTLSCGVAFAQIKLFSIKPRIAESDSHLAIPKKRQENFVFEQISMSYYLLPTLGMNQQKALFACRRTFECQRMS